MAHPESVTAVITQNEPPSGSVLVVKNGSDYKVILRDDSIAEEWDAAEGDHWFDGDSTGDNDPMSLRQHLKDADAAYALGERLADFS